MKTLLEQLLEASKSGVNEFKQTREKSGRTFKDDADEILEELRKGVEKGKGFAKQTREKATEEFKNQSQKFKQQDTCDYDCDCEDYDCEDTDESCDFPFCNCNDECKKESHDEEKEDNDFSLSDLLTSLLTSVQDKKEEMVNLENMFNLTHDINETRFSLLKDVQEGIINPNKTKNAIFLVSLIELKLFDLINAEDEKDVDKIENEIFDLTNELEKVNNYLQSYDIAELIYAIDLVFE